MKREIEQLRKLYNYAMANAKSKDNSSAIWGAYAEAIMDAIEIIANGKSAEDLM